MDIKKIGANLAAMRKKNGMTQMALADRLHISPQAISKWERGKALPELSVLILLSDIYNVSLDSLVLIKR